MCSRNPGGHRHAREHEALLDRVAGVDDGGRHLAIDGAATAPHAIVEGAHRERRDDGRARWMQYT